MYNKVVRHNQSQIPLNFRYAKSFKLQCSRKLIYDIRVKRLNFSLKNIIIFHTQ